jgi:hypothetical protein
VLDRKFTRGDDTLGLVSHVEEDLVAVDLHYGAFDEVTVVEELQSLLDRGKEVFSRADVVDSDLLGCLFGRCGCHVVGAPVWTDIGPGRARVKMCGAPGRRIGRRECDIPS